MSATVKVLLKRTVCAKVRLMKKVQFFSHNRSNILIR